MTNYRHLCFPDLQLILGTLPRNRTCTALILATTSTIIVRYKMTLALVWSAVPQWTRGRADQLSAACTYYRHYIELSMPIIGTRIRKLTCWQPCTVQKSFKHYAGTLALSEISREIMYGKYLFVIGIWSLESQLTTWKAQKGQNSSLPLSSSSIPLIFLLMEPPLIHTVPIPVQCTVVGRPRMLKNKHSILSS